MIAIVTDSTCDISKELAAKHKIHIVPQNIIWGTENLRDGIDLSTDEFYTRLAQDSTLPTTSAPAPGDYVSAFQTLLESANEVLCLTLSKEVSATYQSAVQGAELSKLPVTVFDTQYVSMAQGILVLLAAELRDAGCTTAEIIAELERHIPNTRIYFLVSTLDYLHRGGRIGKAKHLMGQALNIKPILHFVNGKIHPKESVRTHNKALNRLLEIVQDEGSTRRPNRVAVMHGQAPNEARFLVDRLRQRFEPAHFYQTNVCAAVGVHCGPGVVGICYDLTEE